jgi:hypothetical protein
VYKSHCQRLGVSGDTYSNSCLKIDLKGTANVAIGNSASPSFTDHAIDFGFAISGGDAILKNIYQTENSGGMLKSSGTYAGNRK